MNAFLLSISGRMSVITAPSVAFILQMEAMFHKDVVSSSIYNSMFRNNVIYNGSI